MSKLIRLRVNSNDAWTRIRVPRQARPVLARPFQGGVIGGGSPEPPTAWDTYWEVPSNAVTGEETYLIRRGVLPGPTVPSPEQPPQETPSESGLSGATTFFAEDGAVFWIYRDLFGAGGNYPPN
ncbi:hypothetical protein [Nocardia mangyaensis]|uniref:hypothetical protein n=1 Tax=Nocardia mangyaensis TaxID=2213200 RepID=UPI00267756DF|nr:hypothetical protein [Nocardia mangyaensis]MDO3649316.1 hypothetical protein [Nocardia mangyaensis]